MRFLNSTRCPFVIDITFPVIVFLTNLLFSYTSTVSTGEKYSRLVSVHSITNDIFPELLFTEPGVTPLIVTTGFVVSMQNSCFARSFALLPALSVYASDHVYVASASKLNVAVCISPLSDQLPNAGAATDFPASCAVMLSAILLVSKLCSVIVTVAVLLLL